MAAEQQVERIADWARCLRVGVTGHRLARLAECDADLAALADKARVVLDGIDAALGAAPSRHLVSSLAEGADSIVTDVALALGWRLDAVLPVPDDDYAADFAPGADRTAHRARVAATNALFELPVADDRGDDARAAAYERAGRVVLAQSDLVIAVWDGGPARGRGGAAQIVAEAVLRGIPVIHIDPRAPAAAALLWDGLDEHDFGQQSVETVSRAGLDRVPEVIAHLIRNDSDRLGRTLLAGIEQPTRPPRRRFAIAYPLLLKVMGVRRWRRRVARDEPPSPALVAPREAPPPAATATGGPGPRDAATQQRLSLWFARADANAIVAGQTFRSAYVTNFALAALAVIVSLTGLALPYAVKPVLALIELATIASVLMVTRIGRRADWHRRWLDQRHLAERLRCLLIANRLGELGLRRGRASEGSWVSWAMHAAARMAGLPCAAVDQAYLAAVHADLAQLLDRQIAYLEGDAIRMHTLEHRMHRLGTALFATTAVTCVTMVVVELAGAALGWSTADHGMHGLSTAATIVGAALPACGAAIYGIRMQGDFAGTAERGATLAVKLRALRALMAEDALRFDVLARRIARATDLMTDDLSTWLHTYRARPLTLPG